MLKVEELLANPWEPDISARWYARPVTLGANAPGGSEEKHVAVAWPN